MANRQIAGLTARTLAITDVIPTQDAAAAAEAGKNTIQQLKDLVVPKVYAGVLSQSGTSTPTVSVAQNTLGSATLARAGVGDYTLTITGAFTVDKTIVVTMNQQLPIADRTVYMYRSDANTINISVRVISTGAFADWGQADAMSIYILVYPS